MRLGAGMIQDGVKPNRRACQAENRVRGFAEPGIGQAAP